MRSNPSIKKTLLLLSVVVGPLLILEACAARRNLIADGTYALAIGPELTSSVDYVTAKRFNETLTVAGRISSGAGIRPGCPARVQIDLVDSQGALIDSRTATHYSRNCSSYYYIARSARHLRYHHPGRFSAIFWTLPPAGTTIYIKSSK